MIALKVLLRDLCTRFFYSLNLFSLLQYYSSFLKVQLTGKIFWFVTSLYSTSMTRRSSSIEVTPLSALSMPSCRMVRMPCWSRGRGYLAIA